MPKVLVLFHSRTGNTARLADAIAEGARLVRFTEVDVRRIEELAPDAVVSAPAGGEEHRAQLRQQYRALEHVEELAAYDAIVLGSPARHGVMAAEVKLLLDRLDPLRETGALVDKVGSAFTTAQAPHGGHELALMSMMTPMCTLGMILVPPGYTDPVMLAGGSPYGATATTRGSAPEEADLAAARHQGRRVAKVAEWVRHAKGHEAGPGHSHGHSHGHHHH